MRRLPRAPSSRFSLLSLLAFSVATTALAPACTPEDETAESQGALEEATRARLLADIQEIAAMITPELGDMHEAIVAAGNREGPEYQTWNDLLWPQVAAYDATFVYTFALIGGGQVGLVVDSAEDPTHADPWLDPYDLEWQMEEALAGRPAVRQEDPWSDPEIRGGTPHLSAFAPIYNSDGAVIAIVGIDGEVR